MKKFCVLCKQPIGKRKHVSANLRAYYYGAVLPTAQSAVPEWKNETLDDVHEILKKFLNGYDIWNPRTKRVERIGRSAMGFDSSTDRAMDFIEKIREWLATEYLIELPTPEEYKTARDSAPLSTEPAWRRTKGFIQ